MATMNQALDIRKKPQTSAIIYFCLLELRIFGGGACFRLRGAPHCQKVNCRWWVTCWGPASVMTDWSLVTSLMVWWRKGLTAGNDGATRVTRWSRPRTSGLDYLGVKIQNFGSTMYCRHSFWFVWDRISDNDYKTYETSVFLDLNLKAANNHYSNWHQFDNGTPIEFRGFSLKWELPTCSLWKILILIGHYCNRSKKFGFNSPPETSKTTLYNDQSRQNFN